MHLNTCPTSMRMMSPSVEARGVAHGGVADKNGAAGLENFQLADLLLVIARDFQQHVAARARGKQDVVRIEQTRIVGDKIFALAGDELKPSAQVRGRGGAIR